jgi:hypothetical protein
VQNVHSRCASGVEQSGFVFFCSGSAVAGPMLVACDVAGGGMELHGFFDA